MTMDIGSPEALLAKKLQASVLNLYSKNNNKKPMNKSHSFTSIIK